MGADELCYKVKLNKGKLKKLIEDGKRRRIQRHDNYFLERRCTFSIFEIADT